MAASQNPVHRAADRVADSWFCVREDIDNDEIDDARSHIEILRRRLAQLDRLLADATKV